MYTDRYRVPLKSLISGAETRVSTLRSMFHSILVQDWCSIHKVLFRMQFFLFRLQTVASYSLSTTILQTRLLFEYTRFACLAEMLVRSQSTETDLLPCRTVSICPLLTNSQFTPYLQYYIQLSSLSYKSLASSHLSISVCSNHAAFIHHPVQRHRLKTIRYSLENHGDVSCVLGGLRWQELEGAGKKSVVGLARKTVWADKWTRMAKLQNSNARVQLSFGLGS